MTRAMRIRYTWAFCTSGLTAVVVVALLIGCASSGPSLPSPNGPSKPFPVKPVAETIFTTLADRATDNPRYETTDDLVRVVIKLREAGDVTDEQAQVVMEKLGTARRKLTAEDLDAIRGL